MGTVIVCTILFIVITGIIKSLCKKHLDAKKEGTCCCGCSGCLSSSQCESSKK